MSYETENRNAIVQWLEEDMGLHRQRADRWVLDPSANVNAFHIEIGTSRGEVRVKVTMEQERVATFNIFKPPHVADTKNALADLIYLANTHLWRDGKWVTEEDA